MSARIASLLFFLICPMLLHAQPRERPQADGQIDAGRADPASPDEIREIAGPMDDVREAASVLRDMQKNSDLRDALAQAEAVFIIPDYGTAALVIGAAGGEGVLLVKDDQEEWGNPAFYDVGGLSAGLQAGVAAGSMALLLMTERALDNFKDDQNFSITLDAGFSIADWSTNARGDTGLGTDVVVWTDTEGLFAEFSVGFTNIVWDEEENEQYYGEGANPESVLSGDMPNPHQHLLQQAMRTED